MPWALMSVVTYQLDAEALYKALLTSHVVEDSNGELASFTSSTTSGE